MHTITAIPELAARLAPMPINPVVARKEAALRVIALSVNVRSWLAENDPAALAQVEAALEVRS